MRLINPNPCEFLVVRFVVVKEGGGEVVGVKITTHCKAGWDYARHLKFST